MVLTNEMKRRCTHFENWVNGEGGQCSLDNSKNCLKCDYCFFNNKFETACDFKQYNTDKNANPGAIRNATDMKLKLFRDEAFFGITKYDVTLHSKLYDFLTFWIGHWKTTPESFGKAVLPNGWKLIDNKEKCRKWSESFEKENPNTYMYCPPHFFEFVKECI